LELAPPGHLQQEDSVSGDACHFNLLGLTDTQLKAMLLAVDPTRLEICADNGLRRTSLEEIKSWAVSQAFG